MSSMPRARTVPGLVDEMAERFPQREALVGSGQRYTYAQLRDEVRRLAKGLIALGVKKGDKVAILMGNRPEWIIADLAICTLGGVMVSVNTWVTTRELEYELNHSDTKLLITSGKFLKYDYLAMLQELQPLKQRIPLLHDVIVVDDQYQGNYRRYADLRDSGKDIADAIVDAMQNEVGAADVAYLLYTSGSTSAPKGVQLQNFGLIENMWRIGERQRVTEHDRLWLAISLFWGLGCENALFNLMTHGGCVVLQESFDAGEAIRIIDQERCTIFYGTSNMAQAIYEHPSRAKHDISSLRGGATAGTPEQIRRVIEMGAKEICNVYGLTESYGNCNVTDVDDPLEIRLRSIGRPLPGVEQRIVDPETGAVLPVGAVGEIRLRGYVTNGYYKDRAQTLASFDEEGFFKTGDLGQFDAAGYLYFKGRFKEMVKTGGINVSPVEVEEILMQHPQVHLALCAGVYDADREQILAAVIVPKGGAQPSEKELSAFCRQFLAAYKVPRLYCLATEEQLPLTTTGKIKKNELAKVFFAGR